LPNIGRRKNMADMDADAIKAKVVNECWSPSGKFTGHTPTLDMLVNAVVGMPRDRILYADSSAGLLAYNIANENYDAVAAILRGERNE
jgi:hypothetical protein